MIGPIVLDDVVSEKRFGRKKFVNVVVFTCFILETAALRDSAAKDDSRYNQDHQSTHFDSHAPVKEVRGNNE